METVTPHLEFIAALVRSLRADGASATLTELRSARPSITSAGYHDTAAVFYVWAVGRLVDAGLSDAQILWHPLVDARSIGCWWDAATLRGESARRRFVPSTLATPSEPAPAEPVLIAA